MPVLALPFGSIIDVPSGRILARDDAGTGAAEALTNLQLFAILGTGTPSNTTYLRGDGTWSTVSAGVGGSTGTVDNAVLRADGTGGATLQASAFTIPDNFTASPNATVNHASLQATGATTNVSVSIVPKGSGAFSLAVPDGTATGGNARGANAVDLRTATRDLAARVASGDQSFLGPNGLQASGQGAVSFGGTASGTRSASFGNLTVASGTSSISGGEQSSASHNNTIGWGYQANATADTSCAIGWGNSTGRLSAGFCNQFTSYLNSMFAHGGGAFSETGDNQRAAIIARAKTTNNTATEMRIAGSDRLVIPAGKIWHFIAKITGAKSDGSAIAAYVRRGVIKRVANATTLLTVETIGTDYEDNAATDVAITADDTNEALKIDVTGITGETWRWTADIEFSDLGYGT